MSNNPKCQVCGAEGTGAVFNMMPKLAQFKFGEICVPCEERLIESSKS